MRVRVLAWSSSTRRSVPDRVEQHLPRERVATAHVLMRRVLRMVEHLLRPTDLVFELADPRLERLLRLDALVVREAEHEPPNRVRLRSDVVHERELLPPLHVAVL